LKGNFFILHWRTLIIKPLKVLFIGGTGNISSEVSKLTIAKGFELFHLNRGNQTPIAGVKNIKGDIRDPDQIRQILSEYSFDVVVDWIAFIVDHIKIDISLFQNRVQQYIFISSASAYQKPPSSPYITESTPLKNPYWEYSRNKIACEEFLMNQYQENDFPVTIVRPSHTYNTILPIIGPGDGNYAYIDRIKKGKKVFLHKDGNSLWTLTHAADFARGFVGLLGNPHAIGQSFHITSDEILTWNQIYEIIGQILGVKPQIVYIPVDFIASINPSQGDNLKGDKAFNMIFDNTKIKTYVPEFQCKISFSEGIQRTIEWFEATPKRMHVDPQINAQYNEIINAYETRMA